MPSSDTPSDSVWTLADIQRLNLQLEVHCRTPGCGWFAVVEVDRLIEQAGADYVLPGSPPGLVCEQCGSKQLKFALAYPHGAPE